MNKKSISTNYIPLQPPYRIIKYGRKIGVQIGTHVVSCFSENPFNMETRGFPVVVAENRLNALQEDDFLIDQSCEREVWDNIETRNVTVICELGAQLSWQDFIRILWYDHARMGNRSQKIDKVPIFKKIMKYNKSMELPEPGRHIIHLHTELSDVVPVVVRSSQDDTFALNVEWTNNQTELEWRVVNDLMGYLLIISPNSSAKFWRITFETDEEQLRPLIDRLNANAKATRFHNTLMASFTIRAIPTYMDKDTTLVLPESLIDENLVNKLRPIFYGDEDEVRAFLNKIVKEGKNAKPTEITELVNELLKKRIISQKSCKRPLYTVLRDAKLYLRSESNWNSQVKN